MPRVSITRVRPETDADIPLPRRMSAGAAGFDLSAAVDQSIVLQPGDYRAIPTGIAMALPMGYEGQVRPRSGLAVRHGVTCLNAPGTIDSDYRGEVKVILINHGAQPFTVERGMRIAQLVVARLADVAIEPVAQLSETERGTGGFGSTGTR